MIRIGVTSWTAPPGAAVDPVTEPAPWTKPLAKTGSSPPPAVARPTVAVCRVQGAASIEKRSGPVPPTVSTPPIPTPSRPPSGVCRVRGSGRKVPQDVENRQSFARPRSGSTRRVSGAVPVPPKIGAMLPVPRLAVARTETIGAWPGSVIGTIAVPSIPPRLAARRSVWSQAPPSGPSTVATPPPVMASGGTPSTSIESVPSQKRRLAPAMGAEQTQRVSARTSSRVDTRRGRCRMMPACRSRARARRSSPRCCSCSPRGACSRRRRCSPPFWDAAPRS